MPIRMRSVTAAAPAIAISGDGQRPSGWTWCETWKADS